MAAPRAATPGKLPPKTVLYLLIGSGVLVLFVLLGILPMQRSLHEYDRQIEQAKFRIEEQNALHPIYMRMLSIAQAGGAKAPPLPEKQSLGQKAVSEITDSIAQLVVAAGLEAQSVVPDPASLGRGSRSLAVNIHVRGSLERFRAFLAELAMQPSFENIETVRIAPGNGPRDCTLTVWLASE
jgi:Tfp pilus assembly protein PilO